MGPSVIDFHHTLPPIKSCQEHMTKKVQNSLSELGLAPSMLFDQQQIKVRISHRQKLIFSLIYESSLV